MESIPCIKCGKTGVMAVNLEDDDLTCEDCGECFTIEDVEETIAAWQAILPWLKAHPARQEAAEIAKAVDAA